MHRERFIAIASVLVVFCASALGQTPPAATENEELVRKTVTAFWKAFGDLDATGLNATLDWPNIMLQVRSRPTTGPGMVNTDAATFDLEMKRITEGLTDGRKGDFYGTRVATLEVRFLSTSVAYAHHVCQLEGNAGVTAARRRGTRNFEAIAVLRATGEAAAPWKIVAITVPE
jgi:hypothetical protein